MAGECSHGGRMPQLVEKAQDEEVHNPEWVGVLLRTRFWEPCSRGHMEENRARAENCLFCITCYQVFCPHCRHEEPGHRLLKIRRYVYRSIVYVKDLQELNVDVSEDPDIRHQCSEGCAPEAHEEVRTVRPSAGAPHCETCDCWLRQQPNIFCSMTCKTKANVSQDDFSGPEAERRYRNLQPHMLNPHEVEVDQQQREAGAGARAAAGTRAGAGARAAAGTRAGAGAGVSSRKTKAPEASSSGQQISYRTRPRKQKNPQTAPFF